ncbi:hypothetical protein [Desulfamplus magnetovallimortis]|nr:hypothetical protein [Desulfamplus magnetovallimortis]
MLMHSHRIIIYSADRVRGGILKKILTLHSIQSTLCHNVLEVKTTISDNKPAILILDIHRSIESEIIFLADFTKIILNKTPSTHPSEIDTEKQFPSTYVLLLGKPSDIISFDLPAPDDNLNRPALLHGKVLFMPNFDPEKILEKTKKILAISNNYSIKYPENTPQDKDIIEANPKYITEDDPKDIIEDDSEDIIEADLKEFLKLA